MKTSKILSLVVALMMLFTTLYSGVAFAADRISAGVTANEKSVATARAQYTGDYIVISNTGTSPSSAASTGTFTNVAEDNGEDKVLPDPEQSGIYKKDYRAPDATEEMNAYMETRPEQSKGTKSYTVGSTRYVKCIDTQTNQSYTLTFVCMKVGTYCYIWTPTTADDKPVSDANATLMQAEFDAKFPAMKDAFGDYYDADGSGKISLMMYNIRDGWAGSGGYVGGYFTAADLVPSANGGNGNLTAMLHIDTYPQTVYTPVSSAYSTTMHEFQHLINFSRTSNRGGMPTWLNETMSAAAEEMIYPNSSLTSRMSSFNSSNYTSSPYHFGKSLYEFDNTIPAYCYASFLAQYLRLHGGGYPLFAKITSEYRNGGTIYAAITKSVKGTELDGLSIDEIMLSYRAALVARESSGIYGFNGISSYASLKVYCANSKTNVYCGGATVISVSGGKYTVPSDAGNTLGYLGIKSGVVILNPTSIELPENSVVINPGEGYQIENITISPEGAQSFVTYSVDNTSVAQVSSTGYVVGGNTYGTATVTVTCVNGISASMAVVVSNEDEFVIDTTGKLTKYNGIGGTVDIPNNVNRIGSNVFTGIKAVDINITSPTVRFDDNAFSDCTTLKTVRVNGNVSSIGNGAFQNCTAMKALRVYGPVATEIGANVFAGVPADCMLEYYAGTGYNWEDVFSDVDSVPFYKVKFYAQGQFIFQSEPYRSTTAVEPSSELMPTVVGKHFSAWDKSIENVQQDLAVNAIYAVNIYTVTYLDGVDNSIIGTQNVEHGTLTSMLTFPAAPEHYQRVFAGYSDFPQTVTDNLTITYIYSTNSYKLKYYVNGELYNTQTYEYGATVTPLADPADRPGYTFSGWQGLVAVMPAHDVDVNGTFVGNSYTLTYYSEGQVFKTYSVRCGDTLPIPDTVPAKVGHTFSKWADLPTTMPAHNLDINAEFNINQYTLTCYVDNEVFYTAKIVYNTNIINVPTPAKEGCTFTGWSPALPATMPANDVNVYAQFGTQLYILTCYVDGEVFYTKSYEYGDAVTAPPTPEKTGYNFVSWSEAVPETMPARNVNLIARFAANKYVLTCYVDGDVFYTHSYTYGYLIDEEEISVPEKEGYAFKGWSPAIPVTMPANDVNTYAQFDITTYKLTCYVDGKVFYTASYEFGAAVTAPPTPEKTGYNFVSWSETVPKTMPARDLNLTARFEANKYVLTCYVDGDVFYTHSYTYGYLIDEDEISAPEKEGYTFKGWSPVIPATMPANNVNVYAQFDINTYTLTCYVDEEIFYTASYEYGARILTPPTPEKEGYTFKGWSPAIPATMPASDVNADAQLEINTYTLTCYVYGKVFHTASYNYGASVIAPPTPEKEGYTFKGWSPAIPVTMPANDVNVYAQLDINTYTFTCYVDGKVFHTASYEYGAAVAAPPAPTKTGYTFVSWSESVPETMPARNLNLIARFSANKYTLTFYVDGEVFYTEDYVYGYLIDEEEVPTPEKEGYTFTGWSQEIPQTMPAHDVDITAEFTVNTYTLTCICEGVKIYEREYDYGEEVVAPAAPEKFGYTFSGWSPELPKNMPAHDVELTAQFIANTYTLRCFADGIKVYEQVYSYGATITAPPIPKKEGHTFKAWSPEVPQTMPANDVELTAQFVKNIYTLTYYVDDVLYAEREYAFEVNITPEPEPAREWYSFSGWTEIPQTMPAHDVSVYGTFTQYPHAVTFIDAITGKTIGTARALDGGKVDLPSAPAHEGYTFLRWSDDGKNINCDIKIYAMYTDISGTSITVMFTDGVSNRIFSVLMQSKGTLNIEYPSETELAVHDGYSFIGWSYYNGIEISEDMVISALYRKNGDSTHVVTFKDNITDGAFAVALVADGGSVELPKYMPIHTDYEFKGWSDYPSSVTEDITVYANFASIKPAMPGDVNQDGEANTGDAVLVLKAALNMVTLSDEQRIIADFNGDSDINTGDAAAILKYVISGAKVASFIPPVGILTGKRV